MLTARSVLFLVLLLLLALLLGAATHLIERFAGASQRVVLSAGG